MSKIYIYGRGKGSVIVKRCLKNDVSILGYIDNYSDDNLSTEGIPIITLSSITGDFDYIIVSLFLYTDIKDDLISRNISENKIICFFDPNNTDKEEFYETVDWVKWKTELMWKHKKEIEEPFIYNFRYEFNAKEYELNREIPRIIGVYETIELIIDKQKSLARFGDGEFEMIAMRNRPRFQSVDNELSKKLTEVLKSDINNLLIGIANNYGNLDQYTDYSASAIRQYLSPSVRMEHMKLLDLSRNYYDAYLSRPYIMYKDKSGAKKRFEHLKKIWKNQEVLMIEGEHTRSGVGNDLFQGVKDMKRLLASDKNAFTKYYNILDKAKVYGKNKLVLISLGPTATVLTYDLAKEGYWVIDIGQVDIEYEWFLRGAKERCDVPYKTSSEYIDKAKYADVDDKYRNKYACEIMDVIV